ncbi:MAG: STAS domain-containing protein [Rhodospirillaceae bacterium]
MSYILKHAGPIDILVLNGDFDAAQVAELRKSVLESLESSESSLAIDMSNVKFADSSGVGFLVSLTKKLTGPDQKLIVWGLSGQPLEIIKLTRVDSFMSVYADMPTFIKSLGTEARRSMLEAIEAEAGSGQH